MKVLRTFGIALLALTAWSGIAISQEPFAAGTWTKVVAAPPSTSGVGHIQMLTDGSVLALDSGCLATGAWYRLVPDSTGSYVKGTWHLIGAMPAGYNPLYFGSAVLPNGQLIVMGGEYNACTQDSGLDELGRPLQPIHKQMEHDERAHRMDHNRRRSKRGIEQRQIHAGKLLHHG